MIVVHGMVVVGIEGLGDFEKVLHIFLSLLSPPKVRMIPLIRIVCIGVRIVPIPQKLTYYINLPTCLFYPTIIRNTSVQWFIVSQSAHIEEVSFGKLVAALSCAKASTYFVTPQSNQDPAM